MNQANTTNKKLLFVYNADTGFIKGVMNLVHKTARPETYPCKLCMVTFSGANMKKMWKQHIENLGMSSTFLHRNEFAKSYPNMGIKLPAVLIEEGKSISILVSSNEFEKINDVTELIDVIARKLQEVQSTNKTL